MSPASVSLDGESLITPNAIADFRAAGPGRRAGAGDDLASAIGHLGLVLGLARQKFDAGTAPAEVIHRLARDLHEMRARYAPAVWQRLVPLAQAHPVAEVLLQDPFTRWSFDKPRGYSGDAQLLDFIYEHDSVADLVARATPLGRALYAYTKEASSSVAVRERRDILARTVDRVAAERGDGANVLAVAAGHLREATLSRALAEGRIGRWVALDQDPQSVGAIARDQAGTAVEAIDGSVRGILRGAYDLGRFDLVYASGLYDYLPRAVAVKLSRRLLKMVKPGGTFLFANFAEEIGVDGYMETFMNWPLLLRSEADMWEIVHASIDRDAAETRVEYGANRNVVYAFVRKHG